MQADHIDKEPPDTHEYADKALNKMVFHAILSKIKIKQLATVSIKGFLAVSFDQVLYRKCGRIRPETKVTRQKPDGQGRFRFTLSGRSSTPSFCL